MLDINTAKIIKKAIDENFNGNGPITLEDIVRMEPIQKSGIGGSYTILATQYGDLTVLVWLGYNENLSMCVRKVDTHKW